MSKHLIIKKLERNKEVINDLTFISFGLIYIERIAVEDGNHNRQIDINFIFRFYSGIDFLSLYNI